MSKVFVRRFMAIAIALAAIFGIVMMPGRAASAAGGINTYFADENLQEEIRKVLNKSSVSDAVSTDELNNIYKLDISGCKIASLEGIENLGALEELDCSNNPLTTVSFAGFYSLKKLDVSDCSELKLLECSFGVLSSLDVSNCPKLEKIDCALNNLTELNVSTCYGLKFLYAAANNLKSLDLSNILCIYQVSCGDNDLEDINLGYCPDLNEISAYNNLLTGIDTTGCPKLKNLDLDDNPLAFLDVSMNKELSSLYVNGDQLDIKDKKIYVPIFQSGGNVKVRSDLKQIILTKDCWEKDEVKWVGDEQNGYTAASVTYNCTVEGEEDYKITVPATIVKKIMKQPTCEEPGETVYFANFDEVYARDGYEFAEDKLIYQPAAKGHNWGEWVVTKAATVDSEGSKTRTCLNDPEHVETVAIPKLTPTPTPTTKPTAAPTAKPTAVPTAMPTSKPTPKPDEVLSLDKTSVSIICGKSTKLSVLNNNNVNITWSSSDPKVAAVDSKGKVTAKMAGTATITANALGKSMECQVTVLYKDVTSSKDFWYTPTNYLSAKGVVKGYDKQTKFKPANNCTRAQMVTFIWRLQGEPDPKTATCKFKDVKKSDYFYKACIWGNENGIVEGYKNGTFGPQIVCARKHAVTFLWRLANKPSPKSKENKFKDVKKSDYFYTATLWASEQNILAGYSDGTFRPNGDCLRRQMVTFLYKYDKNINTKK